MYIGEKRVTGRNTYDPNWTQFACLCVLALAYLALGSIVGAIWIRTSAWVAFMAVQAFVLMALFVCEFRDRRWKIEAFRDSGLDEGLLLLGVQGPVEKAWSLMSHARSGAAEQSENG